MYNDIHYQASSERYKDLIRYAENERLARSASAPQPTFANRARTRLGKGLVNLGEQLLRER